MDNKEQATNQHITVDEAIDKGKQMLLLPRVLAVMGFFMFGFLVAMLWLVWDNRTASTLNILYVATGCVVVAFIPLVYLPFLFWSKRTTRWTLWAFKNVTDVHQLARAARHAAMYTAYGSLLDKLQIQSRADRDEWAALQIKFKKPETFTDDAAVPAQTTIYIAASHVLFNVFVSLIAITLGSFLVWFAFQPRSPKNIVFIGAGLILVMLYNLFRLLKGFISHQPQITLNVNGIHTPKSGFQPWQVVMGEKLQQRNVRRGALKWFLCFSYPGGIVDMDITPLNINWFKLDTLLRVYRGRSGYGA